MPDEQPSLEFLAAQLRHPTGDFAPVIAGKMDISNVYLFDFTMSVMDLQGSEKILEIGFGSGSFFAKLLAKYPNLKITGLDYSAEMVALAASKNRDLVDSGKLRLFEGSSDKLPFSDNEFDKIYCNMVVYFWDDPSKHLKEVRRVLKPGGKFYTGIRTKADMAKLPFTKHGFNLYEPEEWEEILKKNDFKIAETQLQRDPFLTTADGQNLDFESACIVVEK